MIPNTQTPLALDLDGDRVLVHSVWPTIQGEGPFAGSMAVFVRLVGCNLQCPFCDTDYTSTSKPYFLHHEDSAPNVVDDLCSEIRKHTPIRNRLMMHDRQLVVITGGEPFRQNLVALVHQLVLTGLKVQIETNGTIYQDIDKRATIVCSPKTPKIDERLGARASAFKYVLDASHVDTEDGLPAGTLGKYGRTARPPDGWQGDIFVQPLDEQDEHKNENNLQACVKSVLRFGYRLCIQTHKIAKVP